MLIAHVCAAVVHVDPYVDVLLKVKFNKEFDSNTKGIDSVFALHDSRYFFFGKIVAIYVCALRIVGAFD